jgi:hypothetical protein
MENAMNGRRLPQFLYNLNSGPLPVELLDSRPEKGNFRLAVQCYFYAFHGLLFQPADILCPRSFQDIGKALPVNFESSRWFDSLKRGDVLFAERIRGRDGAKVNRSRGTFSSEELWITYLHSAIFLGALDQNLLEHLPLDEVYPQSIPLVWHATAIAGQTCVWTIDEFEQFYRVVAAKRFIREDNTEV